MKPITLNVADVVKAALQKWNQLGAVVGEAKCRYRYEGGNCCIIGAALPDDVAAQFDTAAQDGISQGNSIPYLVDAELVLTDNVDDLVRLQETHDCACGYPQQLPAFKEAVKELAEKYGVEIPEGIDL